jgi:Zn-dependent peptidase ImmA (M78 family)
LEEPAKFCPECGSQYSEEENFCLECGVKLKDITNISVRDIEITPDLSVLKTNQLNGFENILTQENLDRICSFNFTMKDFKNIIKDIKLQVLKTLDAAVKKNHILLDELPIEDKVLLFSKSFVNVEYKSYGGELGYFEFNRIYVDDRQLPALQITTLMHELSHFLLKEIITRILCELLDCTKTSEIESVAIFILSYTPVNRLMDEYAAHTVEGRFTLFGYQDYSSFLNIQKTIDLPAEEIEIIKTIANSFSNYIKQILESFIDDDLLDQIKTRFKQDILDRPDYANLALENCKLLNDGGMIQAIEFVVRDGFMISMDNIETLKEYKRHLVVEK